jgi:hypothetical protein
MKSLNLDVMVSPEVGSIVFVSGLILVIYGYKQGKKEFDIDSLPFIKPALKELIGVFLMIFGFIQVLPLLLK